jgi:hypothetical protein
MKECIDEAAKTQQVIQRTNKVSGRLAVSSVEVRPLSGNQRLTAVRQYDHKLQAAGHASLPKDLQRLPMEWMMRTPDGHTLWKVLMVGSVSWCPSIPYRTTGCWHVCGIASQTGAYCN